MNFFELNGDGRGLLKVTKERGVLEGVTGSEGHVRGCVKESTGRGSRTFQMNLFELQGDMERGGGRGYLRMC